MDRIIVCYEGSEKIEKAIASLSDYIKNEVLAEKLVNKIEQHDILKELSINNDKLTVGIKKVS
jgi:hypothetical protein